MFEHVAARGRVWWSQYSLRTLMIAVTVFSFVCALFVIPPLLVLVIATLYASLTGMLVIALWNARGWVRAFAVGAALPHIAGYLMAFSAWEAWVLASIFVIAAGVSSVAGIASAA